MKQLARSGLLVLCAALAVTGSTPGQGQIRFGEPAHDFPPGQFSDGNQYRLSDFAGKVVVLYFYEAQ